MPDNPNSDPDQSLWQRVVDGVTPLPGRKEKRRKDNSSADGAGKSQPDTGPQKSGKNKRRRRKPPARLTTNTARPLPPLADFIKHPRGRVPGLDRATQRKFRTGKMTIDARLDLHGLSRDQAIGELRSFINRMAESGARHGIIITGKGQGILRRATYQYLSDPARRSKILAIANAQPRHGGKGAYYVLLRRQR
jgi:DNA-nicking Smr family endonuclease